MILYLVVDTKNKTCTAPTIATDLAEAHSALKTINPENISDLIIHPLITFNSLIDLFLLTLDPSIPLPDFLLDRSASGTPTTDATQQAEGALSDPDLKAIEDAVFSESTHV